MPKAYVSLFLPGQACLKVDVDDGRQVSMTFTRTSALHGETVAWPSIDPEPIKVFCPSGDEIAYSSVYEDTPTALLHALADVLGYTVTKL